MTSKPFTPQPAILPTICRKSGIKFTAETPPGPPEGIRIPDKAAGRHQSVAQAVRAGSKRASMMAESLLAQLQVPRI